jgi:(S)-citramalyl-CoA lyase
LNKFPLCPIFIPANKLDWVPKIVASNADCIIFDLEDSVLPDQKESARNSLYSFLKTNKPDISIFIRINPLDTETGKADLALFAGNTKIFNALMLPKIEEPSVLINLPKVNVILLIETPLAVKNLPLLAESKQAVGIALGGADLSASLGSDMSWDSLLYTRSKIVLEGSINNLFTIDGPFMSISSLDELKQESMLSSKMGFNGKAAIHPSQIDSILEAFLPTNKEIEEAKEVLKAFSAASDGAVALNGKMIDLPVVKSMERRLRLAGVDPDDFR